MASVRTVEEFAAGMYEDFGRAVAFDWLWHCAYCLQRPEFASFGSIAEGGDSLFDLVNDVGICLL